LVNVWVIPNPDPADSPVNKGELETAVQLNEVPAMLLPKAIAVVPPEQNV
jgi:hypothetical protein